MYSMLINLLILIFCSVSLVLLCFKRKNSGSKKLPCFKRKKLDSKKEDDMKEKNQPIEEKKKSRKRETSSSKRKFPNREEKKKTDPPKKKNIKPKDKAHKSNKWYHLQLLVPVTTYVLSPCGKRKKENNIQINKLKEKDVKTAILISPSEVSYNEVADKKEELVKFETAKAVEIESKRNETHLTAISYGHLPIVEKAQSDANAIHLMAGEAVGDYKVTSRLGAGGCGVVYRVISKEGKSYAMKVERTNVDKSDQLLPLEAHVLKRLQFSPYAAHFVQYGSCQTKLGGFRVLIMGLLGPSMNELQKHQHKRCFSIGTVLKIGVQAVRAVAFLHCTYFVHRDIKPSNFAIDEVNNKRLYLFDFGLSRSIKTRGDMNLRRPRADVPFRGTPAYCSLNAHKRMEHGRHDDLWSIFYMLVELFTGSLPWLGKSRNITKMFKEKLIDFQYMFGCPIAFSTILNYLRSLDYYKRPDYIGIEQAFFQMMEARNLKWNLSMDWENERPKLHQGISVPPSEEALL